MFAGKHSMHPGAQFIAAALFAVAMAGCSAAAKYVDRANGALARGDYVTAANQAAEGIQADPANAEAVALLKQTYDRAVKKLQEQLSRIDEDTKARQAYNTLREQIALQEQVANLRPAPAGDAEVSYRPTVPPLGPSKDRLDTLLKMAEKQEREARERAERERKAKALAESKRLTEQAKGLLKDKSPASQRKAAKLLMRALGATPDYADAKKLLPSAKKNGTIRIGLLTARPEVSDRMEIVPSIKSEAREKLATQGKAELIQVVSLVAAEMSGGLSRAQLKEFSSKVDYIVLMRLIKSDFVVAPKARHSGNDKPFLAQTVKATYKPGFQMSTNKDDKIKSVYNATISVYEAKAQGAITTSYDIIDAKTGDLVASSSIDSEHTAVNRWASFVGDRKAVDNTNEGRQALASKTGTPRAVPTKRDVRDPLAKAHADKVYAAIIKAFDD